MKKYVNALIAAACVFTLAGCGAKYEEADPSIEGRVVIHSDGHVDAHVCGDFDKDYYSEDELVELVSGEIADYEGRISLTGHQSGEGSVSLDLSFADCDTYEQYMAMQLFNGNVQGAYDEGYDFNRVLVRAGDPDDIIGKEQLNNMAESHIIVFEGTQTLVCPANINYYSRELKLINQNTVQSSEDGIYFIIY